MIRIKTLALPLISTFVVTTALPANAQVRVSLSSRKSYRQFKDEIKFRGGTFAIRATDGSVSSICADIAYRPPGYYIGPCSPGTTGYISSGSINGVSSQTPYILVTALQQAVVISPDAPDAIKLMAAPASTLPRPSGGFSENSGAVYYNLHTNDIQEYRITNYFLNRSYTKSQRGKFESDIVTGAYHYIFPRLGAPQQPAPITAVIYPMAEGYTTKNKQKLGFKYTRINNNVWNKKGFAELSFLKPNVIQWTGLTPQVVYASVDKLYFSLRALRNPKDPANSDVVAGEAIFPSFTNTGSAESRVLLPSPYKTQFTTPPIFPGGTTAMVELDLERNFQTGGVTYDFSTRRFQIPVIVVDQYDDFADQFLSKEKKKDILADTDADGYNNLTEWILGSDPTNSADVPAMPFPAPFQAVDQFGPTPVGSYYGFNVVLKRGTSPAVSYTLQRSKDQGKTWKTFTSDRNWSVRKITTITRGITNSQIQVRSKVFIPFADILPTDTNWALQPPGTESHLYRVKVTLAK